MINKSIHQLWLGDPMPPEWLGLVHRAIDLHPAFDHYLWDEKSLKRDGFQIPEHLGSKASITNALRLQILHRFGGIYMDVDFEVLKPFDPLLEHSAFAARQDGDRICNAVFGCEKHHPWITWQLHHMTAYANSDAAWGVYLMTDAPREGLTVLPDESFFPFLWNSPLPKERQPKESSYGVHHWAQSWA